MSEGRLSIRGYARHRGVSHTAVRKALSTGRIHADAKGTIDPALADDEWASSTNLSKPRNSVIGDPRPAAPRPRPQPQASHRAPERPRHAPEPAHAEPGSPHVSSGAGRLVGSYADSRAARELFLARLAKLEFEERSGKLVDADKVRAQTFALGRRLRDAILAMPDRLAPVLVGQSEPAVIHRLLTEDIVACLGELSDKPAIRQPERGERVEQTERAS